MATPTLPTDLFAAWKAVYDRLEGNWSSTMNEVMNTENFAAGMGLTREQYLTSQEMVREGLDSYWESLRLTTKKDLTHLAEQIVTVESRVEALEDQLETMTDKLEAILKAISLLAPSAPQASAPEAPAATTSAPKRNSK